MHSQRSRALAVSTAMCFGILSQEDAQGSHSLGLWFRCCRGTAEATVLGFANGSVSRVRDEHSLMSTFT